MEIRDSVSAVDLDVTNQYVAGQDDGRGNRQRSQHLAKPSSSSGWSERGSCLKASIRFLFFLVSLSFLDLSYRTLKICPMTSHPIGQPQLFGVSCLI